MLFKKTKKQTTTSFPLSFLCLKRSLHCLIFPHSSSFWFYPWTASESFKLNPVFLSPKSASFCLFWLFSLEISEFFFKRRVSWLLFQFIPLRSWLAVWNKSLSTETSTPLIIRPIFLKFIPWTWSVQASVILWNSIWYSDRFSCMLNTQWFRMFPSDLPLSFFDIFDHFSPNACLYWSLLNSESSLSNWEEFWEVLQHKWAWTPLGRCRISWGLGRGCYSILSGSHCSPSKASEGQWCSRPCLRTFWPSQPAGCPPRLSIGG